MLIATPIDRGIILVLLPGIISDELVICNDQKDAMRHLAINNAVFGNFNNLTNMLKKCAIKQ